MLYKIFLLPQNCSKFYNFQFRCFKLKAHLLSLHYMFSSHSSYNGKILSPGAWREKVVWLPILHFLLLTLALWCGDKWYILIQKCLLFSFSSFYYSPENLGKEKKKSKKQGKYWFHKLSMAVDILGWLFLTFWLSLAICSLWISDHYRYWFSGGVHVFVIKEPVGLSNSIIM